MATKPTDGQPNWVSDNSAAKMTKPSGGKILLGWIANEKPAFQYFNWLFNIISQWLAYFEIVTDSPMAIVTPLVGSYPLTLDSTYNGTTILVDTSAAARTINLPTPVANFKVIIRDKTATAATNNITLHRHAAENIDLLAADFLCAANAGEWRVTCDGTDYYIN